MKLQFRAAFMTLIHIESGANSPLNNQLSAPNICLGPGEKTARISMLLIIRCAANKNPFRSYGDQNRNRLELCGPGKKQRNAELVQYDGRDIILVMRNAGTDAAESSIRHSREADM